MENVDAGIRNADRGPASATDETHVVDARAPAGARSARPKPVPHFTPAERAARGKAARSELPRSAHAEWEPAAGRSDPVELLEEQARTRLPELGPIRYGRMLVSPFAFFRGGSYLMAADLRPGLARGCTPSCVATRI
jgi:hypothetical protein